ncbi:hypothetical protein P692DRAFT_201680044, partial [Suillus brevipes Sb2]
MTKSAVVEQSAPNKPPKLSAGDITPQVACDWQNACETYFLHKAVDEADQVKMIASGMADPRLRTWYLTQRATLSAGTFTEYMTAFRNAWLDSHWAMKLRKKVLGSQQGTRPFYEWALDLQNQNTLLYGNPSHLSDIQLRSQLEANVCDELTIRVLRAKLAANLTLKEWIEEVKHLDDKRLEDLASHRKIAEELHKSSKRNTSSVNKISSSSSKSYNASSPRLGALTEAERALLMKHKGCFKCRKFYVSHQSKDCTDGAPEASSYKMLTESDATAAKPKTKTVAAVGPVGAVMPSSVLDDGSDSEDDMCVAPFETAHLMWPCHLTGPSSTSSERIEALIDHGSHLVLIDENVVERLGLRRRKLHTKIEANSAFMDVTSPSFSFSEYVLLSPSSVNHDWTSCKIRAIIAPNLTVPLLLGGPFLSHNCLVIDHDCRTCIVKGSNYDLLNSPTYKPHTTVHIPTHHELPPNVVGLLRKRIDTLAFIETNKEHLDRLDKEMRRKYEDRFPDDIPHIDHLPTDIVHRIRLKDPNTIIQCRRYNTPRKYREAW